MTVFVSVFVIAFTWIGMTRPSWVIKLGDEVPGLKDGRPFEVASETTIAVPLRLLLARRLAVRVEDVNLADKTYPYGGREQRLADRQWSGFFLSFRCRTRATRGEWACFFAQSIASVELDPPEKAADLTMTSSAEKQSKNSNATNHHMVGSGHAGSFATRLRQLFALLCDTTMMARRAL
jgi:hypothetical protein